MKDESYTTIQARVTESLAERFREACKALSKPVSNVLREYMQFIILQNQAKYNQLEVTVKVGDLYGRGKAEGDEYYVKASVEAPDISFFEFHDEQASSFEVKFLLPDFKDENGSEPYRVDSFHNYREVFPGSRNSKGRYLGAKLVKDTEDGVPILLWEGAIFLYRREDISNPSAVKQEIEKAIETQLKQALDDYLESLSEKFGLTPPVQSKNSITTEYEKCSIAFRHKKGDDYGAWQMTIALKDNTPVNARESINKMAAPAVPHRFIHFDGQYADYSISVDGDLKPGFKILNGLAHGYVYTSGVAEENNRTTLTEVSDRLNEIIESRLST